MKKGALYTVAAVVLVGLLAVPFAFAQHMGRMHAQGGPGFGMMFHGLQHAQQALGLSDQQVSDIKTIFQDLRQQNAASRQSLRGGMLQIAQTLINDPNNTQAAQALIDQQTAAERTMKLNTLNAVSRALNVLTPDQRAKLLTLVQQRMNRMQQQ